MATLERRVWEGFSVQAILKLKSEDFLKGNNAKFRGKSIPTRGPCSTAGRQKVVDEVSEEARVDHAVLCKQA